MAPWTTGHATLWASGLWLGTRTGAGSTATVTKSFFGRSPWLLGQQDKNLTNWEYIVIRRKKTKKHILNFEVPPVDHLARKFILISVEGSRSAPTRNLNGFTMKTMSLKAQVTDVLCYKPIPLTNVFC